MAPFSPLWLLRGWFDDAIVNPQKESGREADGGERPPEALRLVLHFAEVVEKLAADTPGEKSADAERQESEPHVGALLPGRGEARNVVVVPRLLRQFAKGDDNESGVGGENGGMNGENGKSDHSDKRAQDDGAESGDFLS